MSDGNLSEIVEIICRLGGVSNLDPDQDFYSAGVTSVMALPLLLEMEERFQISIPDDSFISARTARALDEVVTGLREAKEA
jgi:acyl carrier protein